MLWPLYERVWKKLHNFRKSVEWWWWGLFDAQLFCYIKTMLITLRITYNFAKKIEIYRETWDKLFFPRSLLPFADVFKLWNIIMWFFVWNFLEIEWIMMFSLFSFLSTLNRTGWLIDWLSGWMVALNGGMLACLCSLTWLDYCPSNHGRQYFCSGYDSISMRGIGR